MSSLIEVRPHETVGGGITRWWIDPDEVVEISDRSGITRWWIDPDEVVEISDRSGEPGDGGRGVYIRLRNGSEYLVACVLDMDGDELPDAPAFWIVIQEARHVGEIVPFTTLLSRAVETAEICREADRIIGGDRPASGGSPRREKR